MRLRAVQIDQLQHEPRATNPSLRIAPRPLTASVTPHNVAPQVRSLHEAADTLDAAPQVRILHETDGSLQSAAPQVRILHKAAGSLQSAAPQVRILHEPARMVTLTVMVPSATTIPTSSLL